MADSGRKAIPRADVYAEVADRALSAITDEELRQGVGRIFLRAQERADRGEIDLVVLAARRLACLYELMVGAGMPELTGCLVVSDRFVDVAATWRWSKVLILDDSVVVGTTLTRLHSDVSQRVGARGLVQCEAVCLDDQQRAQYLLDSMPFEALSIRHSDDIQRFATEVVVALFRNGIPFFSDFPTIGPAAIGNDEWLRYLRAPEWLAADVTAPLLGDRDKYAIAQIPTAQTNDRLLSRIPPEVGALVDSFKLRSYVALDRSSVKVTFVPIAMLAPCEPDALQSALRAIADRLGKHPDDLPVDLPNGSPAAQHRLVQMFVAACALAEAFDNDACRDWMGVQSGAGFWRDLPLRLYFGDTATQYRRMLDRVVTDYWATPPGSYNKPAQIRLDRPRSSPLLAEDNVQEVLWQQREILAHSGVPSEPGQGEVTKVGLIFAHSIASIFGFINRQYEEPQRAKIAALGSVDKYNSEFGGHDERILNQGFTLRELTEALVPESLTGPAWSRSVVSLGIDIGNDLGIIVPVTQHDARRDIVYRCYRLGETAPLAETPFPVAVTTDDWDTVSRQATKGFPILSSRVRIGKALLEHRQLLSSAQTLGILAAEIRAALPGDIVSRFEGTVVDVAQDTFTAELTQRPGDEQLVAILRSDQIRADDLAVLRPGASFVWTVFKSDHMPSGRDRTSRVRFSRMSPLEPDEMNRSAVEVSRLPGLGEITA